MRILFDQGTPAPLRDHLPEHAVDTAFERGWSNLRNSALLDQREADGYQILITFGDAVRRAERWSHVGVTRRLETGRGIAEGSLP